MMNIIAASRLRKTLKRSNVFFGGVGGSITNESVLNSNLSFTVVSDIEDFKINQFKDVICSIKKIWGLTSGDFSDVENLRFIIDLDGNFKEGIGNDALRNAFALEFIFGENIGQNSAIADNAFKNNGVMYFPSVRTFQNGTRSVGDGGIIFFDSFIENDTGITLDKLRASTHELIFIQNYNKPASITNFTVTEVGSTYAKISLTFPSHTNIMRFVEVWRLGSFLTISENENEIIITGLNPSSDNQIEIFVADQYYNRSLGYKQSILTQATDITIIEVKTGGTYSEFSITNTTSLTITEVEVYVDGVLNTISNKYVVNLNELTSYNINVIAKTVEGIDLISKTINVTTTTIDTAALFQNAVAYYKLDEISGDAIDVVNGYNGTLFGGVTQGVAGKIGTGYSFANGRVDIPTSIYNDFNISNYVISFWFKLDNISGIKAILGQNASNINNRNLFILQVDNVLSCQVEDNGTRHTISTSPLASNQWYFLQFESNFNGDFEVKLNHISQGKHTYVNPTAYQDQISIGDRFVGSSLPFEGNIDELSFMNGQTTVVQDSDLYNNGNGTTI